MGSGEKWSIVRKSFSLVKQNKTAPKVESIDEFWLELMLIKSPYLQATRLGIKIQPSETDLSIQSTNELLNCFLN